MTQSAAPTVARNSFGIVAFLLAMIGLLSGLIRLPGFITLILGTLAVLFGLLGWSHNRRGIASNRAMVVIGTVVGIGAAALGIWSIGTEFGAVDGPAKHQNGGQVPAALADVAVVDCSVTSRDGVRSINAAVKITNTTDQTQTYQTTIKVNDASGTRIGKINAVSNALGAGQSVTVSGVDAGATAASDTGRGPASCVVVDVNRFPTTMSCPPGEVDAKLC